VRCSYGKAFKVPSLYNLYLPSVPFSTPVFDPLTSQTEFVSATFGGNSSLRPETGQSRTIGIVYSNDSLSDLHLSLTHWSVDEANSIQNLDAQTAVSNENLFPGLVVRTNCGIPPCPIDHVSTTYVNFGEIRLRGVDAQLDLRYRTPFGDFTPSLSATETYHYVVALQPGVPPTDRVSKANDDRNFAPRWKGTMALGWTRGVYTVSVDGRYIGKYQDYDRFNINPGTWFVDTNFRFAFGQALLSRDSWLGNAYLEVGAVNLFDKLPGFSNFDFGIVGYDPLEADLRGRFIYGQFGIEL